MTEPAPRLVLVVGASGLSGRYFIRHAERHRDWRIVAVARRPVDFTLRGRFISADLSSAAGARAALGGLAEVTDLVYAGFVPAPSWREQLKPNLALLVNTLDALDAAGAALRRVVLIQGMKYYGSHLGPFKTPAREDDPRTPTPHYYYAQQDHLQRAQRGRSWSWTCLRPHVICGVGARSSQNLLTVIGVYATLCRELGEPLYFPGSDGAYRAINQATDAELLAQAICWAIEEPRCAGQAFNITNGDFFRWRHLWPRIAERFELPAGPVRTADLSVSMADKAPLWRRLARRHGLTAAPFETLVNWSFADYILRTDWDVMASTVKARQAGFTPCLDSETALLRRLEQLRRRRVLP